jgi:hypothetical protein
VATDQKSRLIDDRTASVPSAIENELPTYRAISRSAIFSLVFGALASFSFAHLFFLVFAVLAVILGILANIAINRHPEMLAGRRLANAGAAMGLIFGLVSSTYTAVHSFVLVREAERFGRQYADILSKGSLGDAMWYGLHPEMRNSKTPQQTLHEFEAAKAKEKMMMEQRTGALQALRKRLASSSEEKLRFIDIENQGTDDSRAEEISYFALALFEVEGPANKDYPDKKQFALAIFKARTKGRHYEWWVEDVKFPYQPLSYKVLDKPVDDGHGHGSH